MQSSRALVLLLAAAAGAIAVACSDAKTVTQVSPSEPVEGIPDACFVRKAPPAAAPVDADAGYIAPPPPPSEPIRCANDIECGAGARCNRALSPPHCVTLYCVPEKGACSAVEQCAEGLKCHESRCNACDLCGNLCEVDFTSDPKHCGGCGKKIAPAQKCIDGEATCPGDRPTLCGDECVDTRTDPRHCGGCDKPTPAGGTCAKGKTSCEDEQEVCDGSCVDKAKDINNCGACGHVCPGSLECSGGYCYTSLSASTPQTCFNVCQPAGLRCAGAAAIYTSSTQPTKVVDINCGDLPAAAPPGFVFNSVSCACVER